MEPAKVEITSMEMIKPSSPTPHHLKTLKLSFLDQISPPVYIPLFLFYQADQPVQCQSLKRSLSNALTHYYPLAGRFCSDDLTIDCNDSGALFVEAKIHTNLLEVIRDPKMDDLDLMFLPLGRLATNSTMSEANTVVLAVQISLFDDGGIAMAAQLHHNAGDAISMVNFMNAWAAATRGGEVISPTFGDLAELYPPKDMSSSGYESTYSIVTENIITKRIVFDNNQVEKIRHAERQVSKVKDLTRVEAMSAFFMRRFKDVARAKGSKKPLAVVHVANLRHKMDPPLPFHAFGNVCIDVPAKLAADDHDMVAMLRVAIKMYDGGYVEELGHEADVYLKIFDYIESSHITVGFSSVCKLQFYEVDYGWGRPIWASPGLLPYKDFVVFMPTSSGEGMEALVTILEEDAASIDFHLIRAKL